MSILVSIFLSAALQPGFPQVEASMESTPVQGVVAHLQRRAVTEIPAIRERSTGYRDLARPDTDAGTEGLLFYLSSHAQAVSELSGAPWMHWLELSTFADQQRGVSSQSSQVAPLSAGSVNDIRGLYITLMDARGQRLSSLHKRNAMESTRPERFMVDNKR
jgi:hypothetical protein